MRRVTKIEVEFEWSFPAPGVPAVLTHYFIVTVEEFHKKMRRAIHNADARAAEAEALQEFARIFDSRPAD